jgi:Chaperonin GroEL (HSP60 family)
MLGTFKFESINSCPLIFLCFTDMDQGKVGDMSQLGITESYVVKRQVLTSASEAAEMILRVDNIIKAAPRKRTEDRGHC